MEDEMSKRENAAARTTIELSERIRWRRELGLADDAPRSAVVDAVIRGRIAEGVDPERARRAAPSLLALYTVTENGVELSGRKLAWRRRTALEMLPPRTR